MAGGGEIVPGDFHELPTGELSYLSKLKTFSMRKLVHIGLKSWW